ncbi:hypothetical protein [Streptomyces bauhiniae]|uniref:hypothetical protein n=1 Tax=Streptomyces bauhiniae TaxID=2340725 RepID=UPI0035E08B79
MSTLPTATVRTPPSPAVPHAPFEMRPLRTGAERAEAAALVTDRLDWLARRNPQSTGAAHVPDLFREAPEPTAVGLYDDGRMICCMVLDRAPDTRRWGHEDRGPALLLRHVYSLPGQGGMSVARLLTMWAAEYAARSGLPWVRVEALLVGGTATPAEVVAHLIEYVADLGWTSLGNATGALGERVTRLHLPADHIPTLTVALHCTVPLTEYRSTS